MEYTRQLEATTIVAKPIVPVKIMSLNVKPAVRELQLALPLPYAQLSHARKPVRMSPMGLGAKSYIASLGLI